MIVLHHPIFIPIEAHHLKSKYHLINDPWWALEYIKYYIFYQLKTIALFYHEHVDSLYVNFLFSHFLWSHNCVSIIVTFFFYRRCFEAKFDELLKIIVFFEPFGFMLLWGQSFHLYQIYRTTTQSSYFDWSIFIYAVLFTRHFSSVFGFSILWADTHYAHYLLYNF